MVPSTVVMGPRNDLKLGGTVDRRGDYVDIKLRFNEISFRFARTSRLTCAVRALKYHHRLTKIKGVMREGTI